MLIAKFKLEFSYNQFTVYDADVQLPGHAWTEKHSNQGFARRDSSVSFGTLLQFGCAKVFVFNDKYVQNISDERVIEVPFYCKSGRVFIEGPEEDQAHILEVQIGHYQLTLAQHVSLDDDETLFMSLYFLKVETPITKSKVIIKDGQLDPVFPLLETCETASF